MADGLRIANNLTLPADIAGRRTAVFGISGSGKSNTAAVLAENLLRAGEQVVCVDPKGEGWGLLSLASGKPSNLPVIVFGEPNGHIEALSEAHGSRLADFVVDTGRSVVLSLLGFESDQSERRFVATFLRQLYRRKSRQGKPTRTLVVLDEAHLFVPENVRGDAAELAGAAQRIARQGRTFGIGTLIVDQRPQDVSKRVITQCDTLICHQLVHKTDRDALREWVRGYDVDGRGEQFLESLASLEPGEAWVWSPGWLKVFKRIKVDRRKTYDSGAAPDGSAAARSVQRAEVDLEALRGQLAEVVERARENDPKHLQAEIKKLRAQVAARPAEAVERVVEKEVPVLKGGQLERMEKVVGRLEEIGGKALTEAAELRRLIAPAVAPRPALVQSRPASPQRPNAPAKPRTAPSASVTGDGSPLPEGERKILTAVAQYEDGASRETLTVLTGYKRSSRDTYIQRLRARGFVELSGEKVVATAEGVDALGPDFEPLPTGAALQEYWLERLPEGERKVLEVLLEYYPEAVERETIDKATGYKRSSRDTYLQRLRARQLVEFAGRGEVRASETLFEN
jgi:hypothetical protein